MNMHSSRRRAVLILCGVFFLVPFAMRGARNALQNVRNDPNDWLPSDFEETVELKWFARHFISEKFIVISWAGCRADDTGYQMFLKKMEKQVDPDGSTLLASPSAEDREQAAATSYPTEAERARQMGDRLGLFLSGEFHEGWGDRDEERWLQGHGEAWYFITKDGELYRWTGGTGAVEASIRAIRRLCGDRVARGELVTRVGKPSENGKPNPYYKNPALLTGRMFSSMLTGPQLLEELAGPKGPLRQSLESNLQDDLDVDIAAKALAYHRLTGALFGNAPHEGFDWTKEAFLELLGEAKARELPEDWEAIFEEHVDVYGLETLREATGFDREYQWGELFAYLEVEQPARQTCIIANLSELGKRDMARVVGRPILGKPAGLVLRLAEECGIATEEPNHELRLGGPPVDNVAIDEEGTRTLVKLVGYSVLVGFGLSFLCFRSVFVTLMVFMVGGVSAVVSMGIVYYSGQTADAILMSMPAVVYVLGLSGAVHIVNYYRDSLEHSCEDQAPWRALQIGWWPCTLAASTTAIGLFSLNFSNIVPIKKFGFFSAIGVLATLAMLFAYLPSALVTWPPRFRFRREGEEPTTDEWIHAKVAGFWKSVGGVVVRNHAVVAACCLLLTLGMAVGLTKINTSVQLLKLFDSDAKIIGDYRWMEENLGKLVPMELVIRVNSDRLITHGGKEGPEASARDQEESPIGLNILERIELTDRVQQVVEDQFGPNGSGVMGRGMSAATFFRLPEPAPATSGFSAAARTRSLMSKRLEDSYTQLLSMDYLRRDRENEDQSELWRISLRLGALNDVDYGQFVHDLKLVVEPVMSAYRYRDSIITDLQSAHSGDYLGKTIVVLGMRKPVDPVESGERYDTRSAELQSAICFSTLADLLLVKGFTGRFAPQWHDPEAENAEQALTELLAQADCVVLAADHASYDAASLAASNDFTLVDARAHRFTVDANGSTSEPTAAQREDNIHTIYTGAVPVIYKAQRTLLISLMESIGWAFALIAIVMCFLLYSPTAGLISMGPNVFPVILIFGFMGYRGVLVDIGTMMTASVAMGVAVDDTIHFLMWFRKGVRRGMGRLDSIELAYEHVGTAMTQTTLIGGLGLSVFWLSTFTPTQRFGVMMLTLLAAALVGDLIFLPAILAGPFGKLFAPKGTPLRRSAREAAELAGETPDAEESDENVEASDHVATEAGYPESSQQNGETPHSPLSPSNRMVRRDSPHS